ncbi:hypothetical protein [Salinibaculum rarum]|uniref:hypothetical protein n=1 Tax=Salinibaculum rarum TaxID=3058903 RepID=UPI00265DA159|nr:hypothetical protein [Salinibaculum sp. KK48]
MSETVEISHDHLEVLAEEAEMSLDAIDDPDWHDTIGENVESAINAAHEAMSSTENTSDRIEGSENDVFRYEDWKQGDPCPDCGETMLYAVQASGEKYESDRGDFQYMDHSYYLEWLKVTCSNCDTVLFDHPAMNLLD